MKTINKKYKHSELLKEIVREYKQFIDNADDEEFTEEARKMFSGLDIKVEEIEWDMD